MRLLHRTHILPRVLLPVLDTFDPFNSLKVHVHRLQLGLASEAGEVADKVKKWIRDGTVDKAAISKELGDVLWYIAVLANDLGFPLSEVAKVNLDKLNKRQKDGTIKGSGDNR